MALPQRGKNGIAKKKKKKKELLTHKNKKIGLAIYARAYIVGGWVDERLAKTNVLDLRFMQDDSNLDGY
jgi:hypothetical protein